MNKFDYCFKIRKPKDVALQMKVIYKDLGYSELDKSKAFEPYNITLKDMEEKTLENILDEVKSISDSKNDKMLELCNQLQQKWEDYKDEYLYNLSKALNIEFASNIVNNTYCYLHLLPINEINVNDNIIYLDCNKNIDELFKNFIICLTKAVLLDKWNDCNGWEANCEFDAHNKVWLFADIAVDNVFNSTDLRKICPNPSYKYFYSLKIDGVNIMDEFRKLYQFISLEDFFTSVYMFVHKNYQVLSKFKNYLY